jgi:cardiolipin synthase
MSHSPGERPSSAILTLPNALSAARIALIPLFVWLIIHHGTELTGLALFTVVVATDWVDGAIARRTGTVTALGAVLDPTADRLAIGAGLIALVARGAFPLWAALLILVRDGLILLVGAGLLLVGRVRLEVRFLGKVATFGLMMAVPMVAWGSFGFAFAPSALALGWTIFSVAIVESYAAAALYVGDVRRVLAGRRRPG